MGMTFAAMLMLLLGGGANDLLDIVHSDSYWKAKQVTVSVEQLIADASGKPAAEPDPAAPHAASVRRLMAIRTLGEMKKAEAVEALRALADSKDPFVGDYAKAAIAAIAGKPAMRAATPVKDRMADVWLLPAQSDLVAQLSPAGKPMSGGDMFGEIPLPQQMNKAQMLEQMTTELLPIVERIGNVHLSAATMGLFTNAPNQPGYAVIVLRGQYDSKAAAAALADKNVLKTAVDGQDIYQPDRSVGLILVSDTRAVIVTGDSNAKLPLEEVVAAIKKDAGGLHDNADITKLIATVDTTQPIWAVVKVNDGIRQVVPQVAPFDTGTLVVSQKDDVLSASLKAEGADAEKVKAAADDLRNQLQQGIVQFRQIAHDFPPAQPMLDACESIKIESDGAKAKATATLKGPMSLPLILFGAAAERSVPAPAQPAKPGGL